MVNGEEKRKDKKKKKVLNAHLTMMVIFDDGKYYSFKWQSKCNTLQNKQESLQTIPHQFCKNK